MEKESIVKLRYEYDELVDIQEYFNKYVENGKPQMSMEDASDKISFLLRECPLKDAFVKGYVAIWFLYECFTGEWQLGEEPFTYLKCKVKLNKLRRGASLHRAITYKFVVER
jgi:hypothetical protein